MWIADKWKDYEVLDCSQGEKLENWGEYTLVRPDPQVIWNTKKEIKGWKKHHGYYHRSSKELYFLTQAPVRFYAAYLYHRLSFLPLV